MNSKNNIRRYPILIAIPLLIIIVAGYMYFSHDYLIERTQKQFNTFYKLDIDGKIEGIGVKYKMVAFKVEGDTTEYIFDPKTSNLNDMNIFEYLVEKGDSIFKPAHSDTLKVIKDRKIYLYTFRKF
jgi:hypothetical protein